MLDKSNFFLLYGQNILVKKKKKLAPLKYLMQNQNY